MEVMNMHKIIYWAHESVGEAIPYILALAGLMWVVQYVTYGIIWCLALASAFWLGWGFIAFGTILSLAKWAPCKVERTWIEGDSE